jgi:hypothetical protein
MNNNNNIIRSNTEALIVKGVLDYINEHIEDIGLPCEIELEDIAPKGMSMSLQQITGDKYTSKDIVGNENGSFPFAIYSQNTNVDKLDIITPLWNISKYFDGHNQEIELNNSITVNIEMTGTPGLYSRSKDGTVIYQAIYKVEYYKEVN